MDTIRDYELAIFQRRSQTIYSHPGRRARADRQSFDYTVEEFRAFIRYEQVRAEALRRHGWRMSVARVQQICARAEAKLRKRLAEVFKTL
jgi:G:T-mismatch repair DNA endonuclease (very short patch repair protein)